MSAFDRTRHSLGWTSGGAVNILTGMGAAARARHLHFVPPPIRVG